MSEWQESNLRGRGPKPRGQPLPHTQKTGGMAPAGTTTRSGVVKGRTKLAGHAGSTANWGPSSRGGLEDLPRRTARHLRGGGRCSCAESWVLRSLRIRALARRRRPARQFGLGLLGARRQIDVGKAHADRVAPEERHGQRVRCQRVLGKQFLAASRQVSRRRNHGSGSRSPGRHLRHARPLR